MIEARLTERRCMPCHAGDHFDEPFGREHDRGCQCSECPWPKFGTETALVVRAVVEYKLKRVPASSICPCSRLPECMSDDCGCHDPDACLAGINHTSMEPTHG